MKQPNNQWGWTGQSAGSHPGSMPTSGVFPSQVPSGPNVPTGSMSSHGGAFDYDPWEDKPVPANPSVPAGPSAPGLWPSSSGGLNGPSFGAVSHVPQPPSDPTAGDLWKRSMGEPAGNGRGPNWEALNGGIGSSANGEIIDEDEPPLMDELGIYPDQIVKRLKGVLFFREVNEEYLRECDMVGPISILALLAVTLLATGRMHISYMYSLGIGGSIGMYVLLNLMSQKSSIDLYTTISILGYSLLPVDIIGLVRIAVKLNDKGWGLILCFFLVLWATATSSRFFETVLHMKRQRYLVAYPLFLFYSAFVLLVIM